MMSLSSNNLTNLGIGLSHWVNLDLINENNVIIDAGCCHAQFVEKMRELGVNSKIICLEPCKTNIDVIKSKKLINTELIECALVASSFNGEALFREVKGYKGWGSITDIYESTKRNLMINYNVDTIKIDSILENYGDIDYLKMDIEGVETSFIKDLNEEQYSRIKQISFEVHNKDANQLQDVLSSYGFETMFEKGELYALNTGLL